MERTLACRWTTIIWGLCCGALFADSESNHGTVRAGDFGYDPSDATSALQKAIDSGAKKVVVDAARGIWCLQPVRLRSDLELVFERGVVVRAVSGAYKPVDAMMFIARFATNVVIRGEGDVSLSMCKRDYLDGSRYAWSEWRHLFAFYDSSDIVVSGLSVSASGGDGIYLSRCRNVVLENLLFVDNNRQGVSVISAENLRISHCRFTATAGTPPACGIDFEPNRPTDCLVSNIVEDCEFDGNFAAGASFHLVRLGRTSRPLSVEMRRCRFVGNGGAGFCIHPAWSDAGCVTGGILLEDCLIAANRGEGLSFNWFPKGALQVTVRNTVVDSRAAASSAIVFDNGSAYYDFGGVAFDNVKVLSDTNAPVAFYGMTGVGIADVRGTLHLETPEGSSEFALSDFAAQHRPDAKARAFRQARVETARLVPVSDRETVTAKPFVCQGNCVFVQATPSAGERLIRFRPYRLTERAVDVSVAVKDRAGTLVEKFSFGPEGRDYILRSNGPNIHSFEIRAGGNGCAVESAWGGRGLLANSRLNVAEASGRDLYFHVPAESAGFEIELLAQRTTLLSYRLVDARGNVASEGAELMEGRVVSVTRKPTEKDEIWTLSVSDARKPFMLRFGGNVTPVVFDDPAAGLCQGK